MKLKKRDWISEIKNNGDKALVSVYTELKPQCVNFIRQQYQLSDDICLEIFQQSVVKFYHNIHDGKLVELTSQLSTYLNSISKNLARMYLREKQKTKSQEEFPILMYHDELEAKEEMESKITMMEEAFKELSEACKKLLTLFYYKKMSMSEIMIKLNYNSADSVKTQKYKCVKRLQSKVLSINK